MKTIDKLAYDVSEVSNLIGLSKNSIYAAVWRGEILSVRVGRRLIIPKSALQKLLQDCTIKEK